ncbi:MAG: single-stranded-DNA-specific exonuclease RecJ [Cyanophyceae cyanobacterium]
MPLRPQRWQIKTADRDLVKTLSEGIHPLIAEVLVNRGFSTPEQLEHYLDPTLAELPDPWLDFADLRPCVDLILATLKAGDPIAICGDYDADGMTSTALLLRTLRHFGATVSYEIPSRMTEGYGINSRMVQDLFDKGTRLIITVDNGIAALEPITLAKSLGMGVIITDHHDLPPQVPPADGILNPKLIPESSPYRGMAGVGVAYLLALQLAEALGDRAALEIPLLDLLTLGTIADLAPLTGINRRWVQAGLKRLPQSQILGIRALMKVTGLNPEANGTLAPEAIGFGLGPRINAVGRLSQPRVVIELLTTEDPDQAESYAQECEHLNQERQRLCREIEAEAAERVESGEFDLQRDRVLVILGQGWHHGVIGIVASRLLERTGAPVFIGSQEEDSIRGSARGIPEFNVFEALESCRDLFHKHGGHPAAGGFSMGAEQWPALQTRLAQFARQVLDPDHIQPLVQVDAEAKLEDMTLDLFQQLQVLQPCGIDNREPVFWSRDVEIKRQRIIGKDQSHLKLQVRQGSPRTLEVLYWRGAAAQPLPATVDLAYTLKTNEWQGNISMELEVKGIRPATLPLEMPLPIDPHIATQNIATQDIATQDIATQDIATQGSPSIVYPSTPRIPHPLQWQPGDPAQLTQAEGTILLYGFRRPHISQSRGSLHYDRPQSGTRYDLVFLWSLPPSPQHLAWILAHTHPTGSQLKIAVHHQAIPVLAAATLKQQLKTYLQSLNEDLVQKGKPDSPVLNLLKLGQSWWLSPTVLLAGLQQLGINCAPWTVAESLDSALAHQQKWYGLKYDQVGSWLQD